MYFYFKIKYHLFLHLFSRLVQLISINIQTEVRRNTVFERLYFQSTIFEYYFLGSRVLEQQLLMCIVARGGAEVFHEMRIPCWDTAGAAIIVTGVGGVQVKMDVTGKIMRQWIVFPFPSLGLSSICGVKKSLMHMIAWLLRQTGYIILCKIKINIRR